jgi:hypothetical protein
MAERDKPSKGSPVSTAGESSSGKLGDRFGGRRSHHGNKPGGIIGEAHAPDYDPTSTARESTAPAGRRGGEAEDKDIAHGIAEKTVAPRRPRRE